MTDNRDARYKEFLELFQEEVHTDRERSLAAYQTLFPGLTLEVDKTYRAMKGLPAAGPAKPTSVGRVRGALRSLIRHPILVLLVVGTVGAGAFVARSTLAQQDQDQKFAAAVLRNFSTKKKLTKRQARTLAALVPEELQEALEFDPYDAERLNRILDELDRHEPAPEGAIELVFPRATVVAGPTPFRYQRPQLNLPLQLVVRGEEFRRSFPLGPARKGIVAVFVSPAEEPLPSGEYTWSVEIDYERIAIEDREAARELEPTPHELTFRVMSEAELQALPSLAKSTGVPALDAYFRAYAYVEADLAQLALEELRGTPPANTTPDFQGEARWGYLSAIALAKLGEEEQAMRLFQITADPEAGTKLPGEGLLDPRVGLQPPPKPRGKNKKNNKKKVKRAPVPRPQKKRKRKRRG